MANKQTLKKKLQRERKAQASKNLQVQSLINDFAGGDFIVDINLPELSNKAAYVYRKHWEAIVVMMNRVTDISEFDGYQGVQNYLDINSSLDQIHGSAMDVFYDQIIKPQVEVLLSQKIMNYLDADATHELFRTANYMLKSA